MGGRVGKKFKNQRVGWGRLFETQEESNKRKHRTQFQLSTSFWKPLSLILQSRFSKIPLMVLCVSLE